MCIILQYTKDGLSIYAFPWTWYMSITSLVPKPCPQGGKGLVYISAFWGAQDVVCHMIVMTTHHLGTATHQPLSRTAIVVYNRVSHDNHM